MKSKYRRRHVLSHRTFGKWSIGLRYSIETKLSSDAVRKEALTYFVNGFGLKTVSDESDTLCLEGGGGQITMMFCPGTTTTIEIETQEWDNAVRDFMSKIKR